MKNKNLLLLMLALTATLHLNAQSMQSISSPDKHINLLLTVKDHRLIYGVSFNDHPVIESSELGIVINNNTAGPINGIKVISKKTINKTYPWRGVHSVATDHCNDVLMDVSASSPLQIEIKVFNNGVAFRYLLATAGNNTVNADSTSFTIPSGSVTWSQGDIRSYEGRYKQQNIEDISEGQLIGPPLTVKLPNNIGYAVITEGGVLDFAGMSLKAAGNRVFKTKLAGDTHLSGKIETPWRVIEIGSSLNSLVNCDIIADVSPAPDKTLFPKGFATEWVKPGESVWSWEAGNGDVSFGNMKCYSKWAGELGIPYNLVDEGWSRWNNDGKDKWALIKELVAYSKLQHVKIWVWKAYPDRNNVPGLKDAKARWEFFKQCSDAGVTGIKIDFFDSETQDVLAFYQGALKDAAKLHLMLDFHGADKPTGQSRTWPNEVSREGIRGLENKSDWPAHNTILPFTRYLAGHGDYTPLSFRQELIKGTTLTHQVATVITFTSPFMCLGVDPEKLLTSPVKSIIVNMPTTWDETIVLPESEIGKITVYARRKGRKWYLAVMNSDDAKIVKIDLSFLSKCDYQGTVMMDDNDSPEKCTITTKTYNKSGTINLDLQSGGGFAAVFDKQSAE